MTKTDLVERLQVECPECADCIGEREEAAKEINRLREIEKRIKHKLEIYESIDPSLGPPGAALVPTVLRLILEGGNKP